MADAPKYASRKHPVHGVKLDTFSPAVVFLTVCTKNRTRWLATVENHQRLLAAWKRADAWAVGRYVIMPDHIHLFCAPVREEFTLDTWVRFWKSQFTRSHTNPQWRWRADHWDTRMRTVDQYEQKWEYVRHNPMRAGLAAQMEEWPFQGEMTCFEW